MDCRLNLSLIFKFTSVNIIFIGLIFAQTTGKISGTVIDSKTKEPIVGANIIVENSYLGTASDLNGSFYLINLSPGKYTLKFSVIGYETSVVKDIRVSVNRTTPLNISLNQSAIEGEVVYVKAEQVNIKKDQTSTVKNISSDQIDILPIENVMFDGIYYDTWKSGGQKYLIENLHKNLKVGGWFSFWAVLDKKSTHKWSNTFDALGYKTHIDEVHLSEGTDDEHFKVFKTNLNRKYTAISAQRIGDRKSTIL